MTDPSLRISLGMATMILPSTGRVVTLFKSLALAANTYTMEEGGVDYQVPTGKKLWLLKQRHYDSTSDYWIYVYKHTVADTAGGTKVFESVSPLSTNNNEELFISIEAGKYINLNSSDNGSTITIYGVELDV